MAYKATTVMEAIFDVFHRHSDGPSVWLRPGDLARRVLGAYVYPYPVDEKAVLKSLQSLSRKRIGVNKIPKERGFESSHYSYRVGRSFIFADYCLTPDARKMDWSLCPIIDTSEIQLKRKNGLFLPPQYEQVKNSINNQSYVYYVRWEDIPGYIKIGFSNSLKTRIESFFTGCPSRLEVVRLQPVVAQRDELALHEQFHEYRHVGELFSYKGELKKFVSSLELKPSIDFFSNCPLASSERLLIHYF